MPVPLHASFPPARCKPHGAGFVLVAETQYRHHDQVIQGELTVEAAELLHWAVLAAEYDGNFLAALQKHLALPIHSNEGGSHATRKA
ncbi:hypothetical protein [Ferrovibrio sp.]|uniref:hypothetical protein n=1 Tax=Ferrovibrio sp. TaxID=1917215 RepID=UPI0035AE2D8C